MLDRGDKAPDFSLPVEEGKEIKLSDFTGKKVVLYFYPRDNTPGCTKEACSFRDVYDQILEAGAIVLGVSPDSTSSHQTFRQRQGLPFYLLSDRELKAAKAYGVWGEKKMYGKTSMGIIRSTFIIDEEGTIMKVFRHVKPEGHGAEILQYIEASS